MPKTIDVHRGSHTGEFREGETENLIEKLAILSGIPESVQEVGVFEMDDAARGTYREVLVILRNIGEEHAQQVIQAFTTLNWVFNVHSQGKNPLRFYSN